MDAYPKIEGTQIADAIDLIWTTFLQFEARITPKRVYSHLKILSKIKI